MEVKGEKIKGIFIDRPNRFEALVKVDGSIERAHVPNTGRGREIFIPGTEVVLVRSNNENRKTKYTLMFANKRGHLICMNSAFANRVFEEGIAKGNIDWLHGIVRREVTYGNSRIDFFVEGEKSTFVEVKCGTYEENGIIMFPDAPTDRGRKHIDELLKAKEEGFNCAIVIVGFMDYVTEFTPNYKIDLEFGKKLKEAYDKGIIVKAYNCCIDIDDVSIKNEIKVYF